MVNIPKELRQEIIKTIYERLDRLHWEQLQDDERSALYAAFVRDPTIGEKLAPYMDEARLRVWIKDGPVKEYRRAIEGFGAYATYTSRRLAGPADLVVQALGHGWSVVPESVRQKPMRCDAVHEDGRSVAALWGPASTFKDLYWHASVARASAEKAEIAIVITKLATALLPAPDWDRFQALARLISASCHQVTQHAARKL
jgi:hypothetical protein